MPRVLTLHPRQSNSTGVTCQGFYRIKLILKKIALCPFSISSVGINIMCDYNKSNQKSWPFLSLPSLIFETQPRFTQQINTCSRPNFSSQVTAACLEKSIYPPHLWQLSFDIFFWSFRALCKNNHVSRSLLCVERYWEKKGKKRWSHYVSARLTNNRELHSFIFCGLPAYLTPRCLVSWKYFFIPTPACSLPHQTVTELVYHRRVQNLLPRITDTLSKGCNSCCVLCK